MEQATLLKEIKASLDTHARAATFACGGSIPIADAANATSSCGLVQVRFSPNGRGTCLDIPACDELSEEFNELLKVSQPATFARAGEEILDEDYRKAGKPIADPSPRICPYEVGIVDILTQVLLPETKQSRCFCSIRAELYKLNVYSAPSGRFKPPVDTPRSETQLGSLVISPPFIHEGGQLAVRNAGDEVVFHWSKTTNKNDTNACVKWAAFYSDYMQNQSGDYYLAICEVCEVTSGHRVTLTCNLFVTRGLGHLAGAASALDPTTLPLYKTLKAAGGSPNFFKHGHVLAA